MLKLKFGDFANLIKLRRAPKEFGFASIKLKSEIKEKRNLYIITKKSLV
jgi:hypothetical protein